MIFPYADTVAGAAIPLLGLVFDWLGRLVSALDRERAERLGLQERSMPDEYRVYEHAIALSDAAVGWVYSLVAYGLFIGAGWGYELAFVPAAVFVYHGISAWVWEGNRRKAGHGLFSDALRVGWCVPKVGVGLLAFAVAWVGTGEV